MRNRFTLSLTLILMVLLLMQGIITSGLVLSGLFRTELIDLDVIKIDLNIWRDITFFLLQISLFSLLIIFLFLLVKGISESEGLSIIPFDNTTNDSKYDGRAISDSLISELQSILQIYITDREYMSLDTPRFSKHDFEKGSLTTKTSLDERPSMSSPWLKSSRDNLDTSLAGLGSINIAGTSLPLGQLLINLKRLWPIRIGPENCIIYGSVQKYGSLFRLVASVEKSNRISVWEVSRRITYDYQIPTLIRDLAFKIAKDYWSEIPAASSARTWKGFKHYTIALDKYHRYVWTEQKGDLDDARTHCIEASKTEKDYESLFDLFNTLGSAYSHIQEYEKSEEMFRNAQEVVRSDEF